jgi:hypothetical protein
MRNILRLSLISALSMSAFAVHADPIEQDTQVRVSAAQTAPLNSLEFKQVRGDYALADGRELQVSGDARHPVAKLGDRRPTALTRVADNQFASADKSMSMTFDPATETVTVRVAKTQM